MQTIYLVPHTHYDVAWAFSKEDYLQINEGILEEALKLMKTSNFKFSLEQAFLLESLEKRNPKLWQGLKEMIKKGKLEIVDGQYLMPDTMLPSGEVLVREILFGKRYCEERFGIDIPVAWAADSFGMNSQLPQIYSKAGYNWLAFRRGAKTEITQSEFLWKGLDGTIILSHWMPLGYRAGLDLNRWSHSFTELSKYASTPHILMPCGSGSMPPQPEIPKALSNWNMTHPDIEMKMATPREFFQALEKTERKLETVEGELYDDELEEIFPQVCTSRIWIIQRVRECESLVTTAEEFATIAWLLGADYPADELHEAWKRLLFIAFHDVITGCGVDDIYSEAREIFDFLREQLGNILTRSLDYIANKINTKGKAVAVFNPLPWSVKNWVEANAELPQGFAAELPPLGYRVYPVVTPEKEAELKIEVGEDQMETPFFRVIVDKGTGIIDILDKQNGLRVKGNEIVIDDEIGDLYYHRSRFTDLIKSESGEGFQYGSFKPKSFKIEKGVSKTKIVFEDEYYCLTWPYRLKQRFPPRLYKYKTLDIHKEITLFHDIPRIEFSTKVNNNYPNIRLSVKFDTGINRKVYFRETQFGVIPEPTETFTRETGPQPSGIPNFMSWFDLSDGMRGITFMNRGLPAASIREGSVHIRLLRSINGLSADGISGPLVPTPDALELRPYTFEYALQMHKGDWRQSDMYQHAQEFVHSPLCIPANHQGDMPAEFSFLELHPNNLILSALKKAEDSDDVILRFFETEGRATSGEIKLLRDIKRAVIVDLLEREEKELYTYGNSLELDVRPFEIVTLKLKL